MDMIFTYVAAFELQKEIDYLKNLENQFVKSGGKFYFVELSADFNTYFAAFSALRLIFQTFNGFEKYIGIVFALYKTCYT